MLIQGVILMMIVVGLVVAFATTRLIVLHWQDDRMIGVAVLLPCLLIQIGFVIWECSLFMRLYA